MHSKLTALKNLKRGGCFMKVIKFLLAALAFTGLLMTGCSDKQNSPIGPTDQSLDQSGYLEKKSSENSPEQWIQLK